MLQWTYRFIVAAVAVAADKFFSTQKMHSRYQHKLYGKLSTHQCNSNVLKGLLNAYTSKHATACAAAQSH